MFAGLGGGSVGVGVPIGGFAVLGFVVPFFVFCDRQRRAGLLHAALRTHDPNQIGAADLKIMRSTVFKKMFNVRAGHGFAVVFGIVSLLPSVTTELYGPDIATTGCSRLGDVAAWREPVTGTRWIG